jgi:hypothetical protein
MWLRSQQVLAIVVMVVLAWSAFASGSARADSYFLARTFPNPFPIGYNRAAFGYDVAPIGDDLLVGAPEADNAATNGGAAYLIDGQSGNLIRTFVDPTPGNSDSFGLSLAAYGTNAVIGSPGDDSLAPYAGAAYLFDTTTGDLLFTFANPDPNSGDWFGSRIAVVDDYIVIGAENDDTVGNNAGAAYVFDGTTGELVHSIVHPAPGVSDSPGDVFGISMAAVGHNVIIGAQQDDAGATSAGSAFLFDPSSGDLLRTFNNPDPHVDDQFGVWEAVIGDSILIGAPQVDLGAHDAGAAYLFDGLTGDLIRTFANPDPDAFDDFGGAVGAAGNRILISAIGDDAAGPDAGAVYVFDGTNGSLVGTLLNASPQPGTSSGFASDEFGYPLRAWGDSVVISSPFDDTAGTDAGAVYLFSPVGMGDADGDSCLDKQEAQYQAGTELYGGRRDPTNPWDYMNPSHDGQNRMDDVLAVVGAYFIDAGNPAYNPDTDRTSVGPNAWNLGRPNGLQRIDDVVNIVKQYFHDCA